MAGASYFLFRIWNFPSISLVDALLMGIALTAAAILCGYGIVSGRGTIPESALLVCATVQVSLMAKVRLCRVEHLLLPLVLRTFSYL